LTAFVPIFFGSGLLISDFIIKGYSSKLAIQIDLTEDQHYVKIKTAD